MTSIRDILNRITIEVVGRMRTVPAYIHIPKTGGTYIKQRETTKKPVIWPVKQLGHISVVDDKEYPNYIYYPQDKGSGPKKLRHNSFGGPEKILRLLHCEEFLCMACQLS